MAQNILKVVDNSSLVRDIKSHAVLNANNVALEQYKIVRAKANQQEASYQDIVRLETDINNIKDMLVNILALLKGNGTN